MPEAPAVGYRQIFTGSAWTIGMRWATRGVGLISTAILARLLVPDDFGVVAMATMSIALLYTVSSLGTVRLLIRIAHPDRSHYDTAWTIILIQGLVVAGFLFLCAGLAASYFDEPRIIPVIRALAVTSVIAGFANVGIVNLRKELRFQADFLYELSCKLTSVVATIGFALYFRSYWALVAGAVAATIATVVLSYSFEGYRPRLSLERWRQFLSFSAWMTPSNLMQYFIQRSDALIVGAVTSTSQLGLYHFASEISKMATNEVIVPMGRVLYPSYAKIVHDRKKLAEIFLNVVRTVAIICFAVGPGLMIVAEDFVFVVLGEKWEFAIPLMRFLALTGALNSLAFVLRDQIFVVTGNERFIFVLSAIQLVIAVPSLLFVGLSYGVREIAATTTGLAATNVFLSAANVKRAVPISFGTIVKTFVRPFVAACFMVFMVHALHAGTIGNRVVTLSLDVAAGAVAYLGMLYLLWKLGGANDGIEKTAVEYAKSFLISRLSTRHKPSS